MAGERIDLRAAWSEFLKLGKTLSFKPRPFTLDAWLRCRQFGIDPHKNCPRVVSASELRQRRLANRKFIRAALPHLRNLSLLLAAVPHVLAVADIDGIFLELLGSKEILDNPAFKAAGICAGADWSEASIGNNDAGGTISQDAPAFIAAPEHDVNSCHTWTFLGVPVHNPEGKVIGALNLSVPSEHGDPYRIVALLEAAHNVEHELRSALALSTAEAKAFQLRLAADAATRAIHELKAPLSTIRIAAELIQFDGTDKAKVVDLARRIIAQVDNLNNVLSDMMLLARPEVIVLSDVPIADVVKTVLDRLELCRGGIKVEARITSRSAIVRGHPRLLEIAIDNLCRNACESMAGNGTLTVRVRRARSSAVIEVSDTGPGIPKEARRRIFEPFFTTKPTGTGLGLPIVREIVCGIHSGAIKVRSSENGTTFAILLPLAEPCEPPPHRRRQPEGPEPPTHGPCA